MITEGTDLIGKSNGGEFGTVFENVGSDRCDGIGDCD